jgi:hypothetical protein
LGKRYFGGITQRHFWKQNPDKNFLNDFFFNLFQTKGALTVHFDPERPPSFDLIGGLFLISGSSTFGDNPALVFWTVQFDT